MDQGGGPYYPFVPQSPSIYEVKYVLPEFSRIVPDWGLADLCYNRNLGNSSSRKINECV